MGRSLTIVCDGVFRANHTSLLKEPARSWYWCGRAYAELGDWGGALGCYERACGLANDRMYVDARDEARARVG